MSLNFVAIDIETANFTWDTMCAISLVRVRDGAITDEFSTLINPECDFSQMHTHIHGITAGKVSDAPCFAAIADKIVDFIGNDIVVSHNISFDANCLFRSFGRYNLEIPTLTTFCTLVCSKVYFADLPKYSLDSVCRHLAIDLIHHHDASCDARACAQILITISRQLEADSVEDVSKLLHISTGYIDPYRTVSPSSSISSSCRANNPYLILNDLRAAAPNIANEITMSHMKDNSKIVFKCEDSNIFIFNLSSSSFIRCESINDGFLYSPYAYKYKNGGWKLPIDSSLAYEKFIADMSELCLAKYKLNASYIFGCCNDFINCSDARHCLKADDPFYRGCQYRKNIESGRIFYGVNRNI